MAEWSGRCVLVTGSSGFLGVWVVEQLQELGAKVVAYDKFDCPEYRELETGKRCLVVRGDINCLESLLAAFKEHQVTDVLHLAGQSGVGASEADPFGAFEANVRGTYTVLEAMRLSGQIARAVMVSSNHVYGAQTHLPSSEDAFLQGIEPYAASKLAGDLAARCFASSYNLPLAVARITNTFGPADPHVGHLVTGAILSVLRDEAPVIRGDGQSVKGYLYVEDAVGALVLLLDRAAEPGIRGEAFNFAPEEPISVIELTRMIIRVASRAGLEPMVLTPPRSPSEVDREHLDISKAKRLLGWQPQIKLEEGLRRTLDWYRARA